MITSAKIILLVPELKDNIWSNIHVHAKFVFVLMLILDSNSEQVPHVLRKTFFENLFIFATAVDLNKCLK